MPRKSKTPPINVQQTTLLNRAAIYLRVSTDDQVDDGYGLDVQRARTLAQIAAKGWTFAGEYGDPGISGTKDASERPGLAALLSDASAGKIDSVVVLALDRLGRKTSLVLALVEQLAADSVALVSCKESLDTSTPQGQFVLTMFAALAQLERDVIVERTTAGRDERGRRDGEKGGRVPMGYVRQHDGSIVVDPERAEQVRHIFTLRRAGDTLTRIAEQLDVAGITTMRGCVWHASSVREVLLNEPDYHGGKRGESDQRWQPIL